MHEGILLVEKWDSWHLFEFFLLGIFRGITLSWTWLICELLRLTVLPWVFSHIYLQVIIITRNWFYMSSVWAQIHPVGYLISHLWLHTRRESTHSWICVTLLFTSCVILILLPAYYQLHYQSLIYTRSPCTD